MNINSKIIQLILSVMLLGYSLDGWSQQKSAEQLITEARELQASGDAEKSLSLLNEARELSTFSSQQNTDQLAEINTLQAVSYSMKYEWAKAIKYGLMAKRMLGLREKSPQYSLTLYNLAKFYAGRGNKDDYDKAIGYAVSSRELFEKKSQNYFYCNNDIVYYYILNNNEAEATNHVEDAIDCGKVIFGNDKATYAKELWKYANKISELEKYKLAAYYAQACLRIMEENNASHTTEYIRRTIKLAGFYYQKREFNGEINTLTKIVQISKEMDGEESNSYVDCLRKLALAYNHKANEIRGERKYKELYDSLQMQNEYYEGLSREILIKTGNINEIRTYQIPLIGNQAQQLFTQHKYQDAIHYGEIAYILYNKEKDSLNVALTTSNIAEYFYNYNNQVDSAYVYGKISTDIYDRIPRNMRSKGLSYNNMAMFSHTKSNEQEAVDYETKAINTLEQCGDTLSDIYVKSLGNASVYYHELGNEQQAAYYSLRSATAQSQKESYEKKHELALAKKLKRKQRKIAIKQLESSHYVDNNMVVVQWNKAMYAQEPSDIHSAYSKAVQIQRDVFLQNYPAKSEADRSADWSKRKYVFDYAETLAFSYDTEDSLIMDAYNAMLIRDGMPKFIESGDSSAITTNWKAVATKLDPSTVMVRFFITPTDNRGDAYSALLLHKSWTAPKLIRQLFTEGDLTILQYDPQGSFKDIYKTDEGRKLVTSEGRYGRMIWSRIIKKFDPTITTIKYQTAGVGVLDELDPATLSIEENAAPINQKYKMTK